MPSTPGTPSLIKTKQLKDLLQKEEIVEYHNIPESTVEGFLELADRENLKLSYKPHTKKIKIVMRKWIHSGCLN
ncbi:hypothetical protein EMCG_06409 [[Emmonsia] crescens]|uniref:Uncharacterized protein n=1 Tax=[Emmonsia] crescens TaxID=73230 RepID=A0A0G2IC71_9EURO|nr:hypothetical protein EMCG_06409 [Emmonsia crescens UAMH 3008]